MHFYKSVYLEVNAAQRCNNRDGVIHARALYQSKCISAIKCVLLYYHHVCILVFFHVLVRSLLLRCMLKSALRMGVKT